MSSYETNREHLSLLLEEKAHPLSFFPKRNKRNNENSQKLRGSAGGLAYIGWKMGERTGGKGGGKCKAPPGCNRAVSDQRPKKY